MADQNNKVLQKPEGLSPEFSRVWDEYGETLQAISDTYISLATHHDMEGWRILNMFISMASQTCVHLMSIDEKNPQC